jgi:hypothetical protein
VFVMAATARRTGSGAGNAKSPSRACLTRRESTDFPVNSPIACLSFLQVIWDLSAKPLDGESCEYTNHINAYATDEFIEFITEHGITFEQAAASRHFAKSIEGCALGKDWHTF